MNSKTIQLLEKLIEEEDYQTISFYAQALHVSTRTVFNYLSLIEDELQDQTIYIHKVQGTGICLIGSKKDKIDLLHTINGIDVLSTLERQLIITQMLIIEERTVTYQGLSDYFMVSTSSITKDLEKIQNFIQKYSLILSSHKKGTSVQGNEYQKQICMVMYLEERLAIKKYDDEVYFYKDGLQYLELFVEKEIIQIVYHTFTDFMQELNANVSEKYLRRIILTFIIFLSRLKKGCHPYLEKDFLFEEIKCLDTYIIAKGFLIHICSQMNISYEENDIDFINKQLVAFNIKPHQMSVEDKYIQTVKSLISNLSDVLQTNLNEDQELLEGLLIHFVPMIYRLKMNIDIKNPLLNEIKNQYSILFTTLQNSIDNIEKDFHVLLTEDEIAFLTVYFQVSLERNKEGKKILIVCPSGIGTSELIFNKIEKAIPAQDTLEISTLKALYQRDLNKIDLIISTVDIAIEKVPIIRVGSLINNNDLKKIAEKYANFFYVDEISDELYRFEYIDQYIESKYIYWNMDFHTKEECLHSLMTDFKNSQCVTDGFEQSVFDREKIGTTALDSGVAIPHASVEYVLQTRIVIMNLNHKIQWNDKKVDVVVLICISKDDKSQVKTLLSEVYHLISNRYQVEQYFKNKTKHEFLLSIKGGTEK